MAMVLFVLGILTVIGVAVWVSGRTVGAGRSRSNRYLGDASSGNDASSGIEVGFGSHGGDSHHDHGGGWSGGDGGGSSGGGGGD